MYIDNACLDSYICFCELWSAVHENMAKACFAEFLHFRPSSADFYRLRNITSTQAFGDNAAMYLLL